jgi:hypothetical protein
VPRHHLDSHLVDAILRLVGGVFFTTCDIAGPQAAAVAVERLRSFGDVNSDNHDCHALCHALADMQEDALHAKDYDFRQSMKTAN